MDSKLVIVFSVLLLIGIACAVPVPKADAAFIAPAVVTATSSQVIARNYNGIVPAPLIAAPAVAPVAPFAAAPLIAAPYANYPYTAPYSPYFAYL